MTAKSPVRWYFLIFGATFLVASVGHLIRFTRERDDIWWTPRTATVSLPQSRSRVEVYIRGTSLEEHIKAGRLQLLSDRGPAPLTEADIGVRLNNWDRVRAERIPFLVSAAAGAGAAGIILLFGLIGWVPAPRMEASGR